MTPPSPDFSPVRGRRAVPEGDTVHLAATRLNAALAGQRLLRTDFRVPAFATADLTGRVVTRVLARGKHLLFRTDGAVTLHTHFRMDGRWTLYRPGRRWHGPSHEIRAILVTEPWVAVGTLLAITELVPTPTEADVLGHLGPDVLGPDWDPDEALHRLLADPDRAIGEAVIDQGVMAGPGNVFRCEVLFLRGLDPWTPVGSVPRPDRLVSLVKELMEANRATGAQVTTGDLRHGRRRWVYGRVREPCRRCGTPIRRRGRGPGPEAERVTYWCPRCQPPVATLDRPGAGG